LLLGGEADRDLVLRDAGETTMRKQPELDAGGRRWRFDGGRRRRRRGWWRVQFWEP
jgi:hypothetical protein